MASIRIVNEEGYKALRNLALTSPKSFINPDPQRLIEQMISEAGTESVWGRSLDLKGDLSPLNEETEPGHWRDGKHSRTLRVALSDITLPMASDDLLWASVNCFALADYVPLRWQTSNTKNSKPENFVLNHWLEFPTPKGRESNTAARLWWMSEIAKRISQHSGAGHTEDELLDAMSANVNFYHQAISRPYLTANPKLLAAMYDVFLDGNDHLNITKNANAMLKSLNLRAAAMSLDMMDYDELRAVIEEAKPPKG